MIENNEITVIRRKTKWYTHVGDFLNTLKAFIGINYQVLPFAFAQSGLALGIVGVFLIATLTDHCCQLLVRSKNYIIEKACREDVQEGKINEDEVEQLRERLQLTVSYGDIGKRVFGNWCFQLIQVAVWFTQFVICIVYFVFIANTISAIFPLKQVCTNNSALECQPKLRQIGAGIPMLSFTQLHSSKDIESTHCQSLSIKSPESSGYLTLSGISSWLYNSNEFAYENITNGTQCNFTDVSTAPDERLISLWPLPLFLCTSIVRNVRFLAPFSTIATVALAVGACSVAVFLIDGFTIVNTFEWYKILTLPFFFCQLISAYEGIGCILPIQSSMVGSRHLFSKYLHVNIYIIFIILCTYGIIGYLRYGDDVQQIIVLQIRQHTVQAILVDVTLIISVLFTYPLQCFPVIQIVEAYIFVTAGKFCRCITSKYDSDNISDENEQQNLLVKSESLQESVSEVANTAVPPDVPAWKRNVVRILLTFVIAGLAVLFRNYFAYLSTFSGAVGASLLALILPCMLDIRLRYPDISKFDLVKDICIIIFAVCVSILGLVVIVFKIINNNL